ncbi:MAG: L,D-transpeptidase [Verrucomicrobia bacterium]|nr:L,D-transpeptidase [Verrucomicrobiota bacterium]
MGLSCVTLLFFCQCASVSTGKSSRVVISVKEQKLALYKDGNLVKKYPVSTSKFGEGDKPGSYRTPLGTMKVAKKIGGDAPKGAVFKSRQRTGEVLKPNSPGRDPIVSRIIWLTGTEKRNRHAYERFIYIHGTAEESKIGQVASYGCIRMRSRDVINLYKKIGTGTEVEVVRGQLPGSMLQTTIAPAIAMAKSIANGDEQEAPVRVPPSLAYVDRRPALILSSDGGSSWSTPASSLGR